ncbi:MAG: IS701 family transposase [Sulfuricaulis sp.]|nr:IS701 family transposase [Sulfuricaulis sp.]
MELIEEFAKYLDHVTDGLGRLERKVGLKDYCRGLMLPLKRKSIEPLAAAVDPCHVPARHQSLQHFVADSPWSDEGVLSRVQSWVLPKMLSEHKGWVFLIADDTGMPKAGTHSVGVARQYCGQLGKTDNCQVAVSLSIATAQASLPVKYRLYLPQSWTDDRSRCEEVGVPQDVVFLTKPQISLAQIRQAKAAGLPGDIVAADAAYGDDTDYRDGITELGLLYVLGIKPGTTLWAAGTAALPPKPWSGRGKKPTRLRRDAQHQPVSAKQMAMSLPRSAYRKLTWREGTNAKLSSRFAAVRVTAAHLDYLGDVPRDEEWLLIEWPKGEPEPTKYFLSTLPANISHKQLVDAVKSRWRIERDYQELKQEFGLDNFEGRNWRGFHHHASLCIAAYGFLVGERLAHGQDTKKNTVLRAQPALPEGYIPRGTNSTSAPRPRLNSDPALVHRRRARSTSDGLPSPPKQSGSETQT